jgi:TM2 domain-containing membrane protein YozV
MKAKVFNNIFVGFSLRFNRLINNKQPANFENLYIPGFNRTYNGDFGVGFNYTVTYFVPIFKKVVKAPETKKTEKK